MNDIIKNIIENYSRFKPQITWQYKNSKNIQKMFCDFIVIDYLNNSKNTSYFRSKNTNKELNQLFLQAFTQNILFHKKFLKKILISICYSDIIFNNEKLKNKYFKQEKLSKHFNLEQNFYKNISLKIKKTFQTENKFIEVIGDYYSDIRSYFLLLNENDMKSLSRNIRFIYNDDKVLNILPKYNHNWEYLIYLSNHTIKKLIKYTTIPIRIWNYFFKFKGLNMYDNNNPNFTQNDFDKFKKDSYQLLYEYLINNSNIIRNSLISYKIFNSSSINQLKIITNDDSIKNICYDLVYNNKYLPMIFKDKHGNIQISYDNNTFNPFRYYELNKRTDFTLDLNNNSKYKKILSMFFDVSDLPKSLYFGLGNKFIDFKDNYIKQYNFIIPNENYLYQLEKKELNKID